jgi:hypothetical protein
MVIGDAVNIKGSALTVHRLMNCRCLALTRSNLEPGSFEPPIWKFIDSLMIFAYDNIMNGSRPEW